MVEKINKTHLAHSANKTSAIDADDIPNKSKRQNTKQNVIASYYAFLSSNNNDADAKTNKFKNARIVKSRRSKMNRQRDSKKKRLTRKARRDEHQSTLKKEEEQHKEQSQAGGGTSSEYTTNHSIYRPPLLPD